MDTILAFFIGLGTGIIYYFIDYRKMTDSYRNWHKLTHKEGLTEDIERGFVYAQPFSGKLYSAIFLTVVITSIIILTGSANILVQLMYGLFIALGLMVAFYVAPVIFRHAPGRISKMKEHLDKIDEFESRVTSGKSDSKTTDIADTDEVEPEPEKKKADSKNDDDWRKGIKDYLND